MVFFNYALRKLNAKIVYYGPGLCGKTTNLQWIHDHFEGGQRGRMISLATEGDRTIFFDLLPLEIGTIRGMQVTLQLYTVPGQVHYNSTRQLVLKGADGVVFVADSQRAMLKSNQDSWRNLQENLLLQGVELRGFPHVVQFNKRDLRDIMSIEDLDSFLNQYDCPIFEAIATDGVGVQETLEGIVKLVMRSLKERYEPVAAGPQGPQPTTGVTPGPWPVAGAPSATRPSPIQAPHPPIAPRAAQGATQPLSAEPSGVVTREVDAPAAPPPSGPMSPAQESADEDDNVPTLVSEEETLEDRDIVVPTFVPEVERDAGETASGRELFSESEMALAGPAGDHPIDQPVGFPPEPTGAEQDLPGGGSVGDVRIETWPEHEQEPPIGDVEVGEPPSEQIEVGDVPAETIEPEPALDEPFAEGLEARPEPTWAMDTPSDPFAAVDRDESPVGEALEGPLSVEPTPAVVDVDLDALRLGSADEASDDDLDRLDFDIAPERPAVAEREAPSRSPWSPAEPFFVSEGEPFDDGLGELVDEPSGPREVAAEASALVTNQDARVGAIDVDPVSNQLHVRLHGKGALAEYGQVRELDVVVPVPGQWIGNRRVTLQLRLTLSPLAEGQQEDPDGAS